MKLFSALVNDITSQGDTPAALLSEEEAGRLVLKLQRAEADRAALLTALDIEISAVRAENQERLDVRRGQQVPWDAYHKALERIEQLTATRQAVTAPPAAPAPAPPLRELFKQGDTESERLVRAYREWRSTAQDMR